MGRHGDPASAPIQHRAPHTPPLGRPRAVLVTLVLALAMVAGLGAFAWSSLADPDDADVLEAAPSPGETSRATADCPEPLLLPVAVAAEDTDLVTALIAGTAGAGDEYRCLVGELRPVDDGGAAATMTRTTATAPADATVVAQTAAVAAVPEPLIERLGWAGRAVSAQEVLPVAEVGAGAALSEQPKAPTLAIVDPATPAGSASLLGLAGLATSGLVADFSQLTSQDMGQGQAQATLLGLYQAVRIEATSEAGLIALLQDSDRAPGLSEAVSVALVDELTVNRFNALAPKTRLVALSTPTAGGFGAVRITMTVADGFGAAADAARAVVAFASSEEGRRIVIDAGYRDYEGLSGTAASTAPPAVPAPDAIAVILAGWREVGNPGRILFVLDVSGSMAEEVPGTGRSKLEFVTEAAATAVTQAPRNSEMGLWEFSRRLDGEVDHRELVPLGLIEEFTGNQTRQELMFNSLSGLVTYTETGLYDTALAAFRSAQASYQPGEANLIVLLTDGRNDDPGSPDLEAVVATLTGERDPERPVAIVTIAYGGDADTAALTRIAEATGGASFNAPDPRDISRVLLSAFTAARGGAPAGGPPPGAPGGPPPGAPGGPPPGAPAGG